jgi:hypothetical protein
MSLALFTSNVLQPDRAETFNWTVARYPDGIAVARRFRLATTRGIPDSFDGYHRLPINMIAPNPAPARLRQKKGNPVDWVAWEELKSTWGDAPGLPLDYALSRCASGSL